MQPHSKSFDLVKIRGKSEEISAKYVYCVNLRKIAVHALILQKWHPKILFFFFGNHLFILEIMHSVIFGQVKGNLGKFWCNLGKNGA